MKFECINKLCDEIKLLKGSSPSIRLKVKKVGGMWHLGVLSS